MSYPLTKLNIFAEIQARLNAVKPENLASLSPGKPVPDGATVIGELTPILKALLWVRDDLVARANQLAKKINAKACAGETIGHGDEITEHSTLTNEAMYYYQIFRSALAKEYPELKGVEFNYGPDFEVYMYTPQHSLIIDLIGATVVSSTLSERRADH